MGKSILAVLSGIKWISENPAVASYTTWNAILTSVSSLRVAGPVLNHFFVGRFFLWTAIILVNCMSFIDWYINNWDLIEKSWLIWQVNTQLSPFWRQQEPPPPPPTPNPPHAVTSMLNSEITHHLSQHLYVQPYPWSIGYRSLLAKSLVINYPKEIPHCCLVTGDHVQWCLVWFKRSGTPPPNGTAVKFWPKSLFFMIV